MIESEALRNSAGHHDAACMLNIAGVCDPRTGNMLCHIRFPGAGGLGLKPSDLVASFGCKACHDVFDGRTGDLQRGSADWFFYGLRGIARTHEWWLEHGFLKVGEGA